MEGKKPVMLVVDTEGPHQPLGHYDPLVWETADERSTGVPERIKIALSSALSAAAVQEAEDNTSNKRKGGNGKGSNEKGNGKRKRPK